jgi:hypothetical protein
MGEMRMGITIGTAVVSLTIGSLVTYVLSKHYYHKSSGDIVRLVKQLAGEEELESFSSIADVENAKEPVPIPELLAQGFRPERAAAKLLLELLDAFEKHEIYWPEFIIAVRAMQQAGKMAGESVDHIFLAASQGAMPTTPEYHEIIAETRRTEMLRLRQSLQKYSSR